MLNNVTAAREYTTNLRLFKSLQKLGLAHGRAAGLALRGLNRAAEELLGRPLGVDASGVVHGIGIDELEVLEWAQRLGALIEEGEERETRDLINASWRKAIREDRRIITQTLIVDQFAAGIVEGAAAR